jgi:CO dehydrogenase maturation factor
LKVAISGKGGVGKTTLAGILARTFAQKGYDVLAIDADPNANLAINLGIPLAEAQQITPISENSTLIEEKTGVAPDSYGGVFRLSFQVSDIVQRYGIQSPDGVNLLVMGVVRTAGQGCMCPANALIRAILRHILLKRDEAIVLDMEAGTEHFGRRTAEHVDVMLVVADANRKALETAKHILNLSKELGIHHGFIVGNRVLDSFETDMIQKYCDANQLPLLHIIPYDQNIRKSDVLGEVLPFSSSSSGFQAAQSVFEKIIDRIHRQQVNGGS